MLKSVVESRRRASVHEPMRIRQIGRATCAFVRFVSFITPYSFALSVHASLVAQPSISVNHHPDCPPNPHPRRKQQFCSVHSLTNHRLLYHLPSRNLAREVQPTPPSNPPQESSIDTLEALSSPSTRSEAYQRYSRSLWTATRQGRFGCRVRLPPVPSVSPPHHSFFGPLTPILADCNISSSSRRCSR